MNEKNYFRNRIASEDNMKLFETTTHIEWSRTKKDMDTISKMQQ